MVGDTLDAADVEIVTDREIVGVVLSVAVAVAVGVILSVTVDVDVGVGVPVGDADGIDDGCAHCPSGSSSLVIYVTGSV